MKTTKQVLTTAQKQRLADRQINEAYRLGVWVTRLQRKALEHKVYHVPDLLGKAQSIVWRDNLSVGCSNLFGANWTTPGTLRGLVETGDLKLGWLGEVKAEWISKVDDNLWVAHIPHCYPRGVYDVEPIQISNYNFMVEEYKDLIAAGVLYEDNQCLVVDLDKVAPDVDRLLTLCETLHGLSDYPCLDEDGMYAIERENEDATLKSEASSFDDKLDIADFIRFPLIRSVTGETVAEIKSREQPSIFTRKLTKDQETVKGLWERCLIGHMYDLIRQHNIEFGNDGKYIDVDALVKLSPLKDLGQEVVNILSGPLYEIEDQLLRGVLGNPYDKCCLFAKDLVDMLKAGLKKVDMLKVDLKKTDV